MNMPLPVLYIALSKEQLIFVKWKNMKKHAYSCFPDMNRRDFELILPLK